MNKSKDKVSLIFVYNADSSPINQALDFFYRLFSPETYSCNLSKLTQDKLNVKSEWKLFLDKSKIKAKYYHRDMFAKKYPEIKSDYPIIFRQDNSSFKELISPAEINSYFSLKELMDAVSNKLK